MSSFEFQSPTQEALGPQDVPQKQFQASCFARIDELVAEGVYPQKYADERKEAAQKIEDGLTDPEVQGVAFAEIGMSAIKKFREMVDVTEMEVGAKVEDTVSRLDEIQAALLARKVVPIDIKERLKVIDVAREEIFGYLEDFQTQLGSVRDLQAKLSVSTADEELQSILNRVNEDDKK